MTVASVAVWIDVVFAFSQGPACRLWLCFIDTSVHAQEFVGALAAFSSKATRDDKLHLIFTVYDVDGDGVVSAEDMELMLRQLAGSSLG